MPVNADTQAELNAIRAELSALLERVALLEAENSHLKSEQASAPTKTPVRVEGDFRYRYENIDKQSADTRERNRIRARVAVKADLPGNLSAAVGLASGGDDPLSTNQTLGKGASSKGINLDLAYLRWEFHPGAALLAGKHKNVFFKPEKSALIWDGDLNPEGIALTFDTDSWFTNAALSWLESDSRNRSARFFYGVQTGFRTNLSDSRLTVGGSLYNYNVEGQQVFYGDNVDFYGNSFSCTDPVLSIGCSYLNDYRQIELFAHLKSELSGRPLALFADYVRNTDADRYDTGWSLGFKYGKASGSGSWEFGYTYQDLEADAVFGLTADSDFGDGGTDADGHIVKAAYAINKKWKVGFTYLNNRRNENLGTEQDYDRLQVDTALKF